MTGRNPWEVLGVAEGASDHDVRRAYRARVLQTHPDRGGDARRLDEVVRAYGTLRRPGASSAAPATTPYDRWLRTDDPPPRRTGARCDAARRGAVTGAALGPWRTRPGAFAAVLADQLAQLRAAATA